MALRHLSFVPTIVRVNTLVMSKSHLFKLLLQFLSIGHRRVGCDGVLGSLKVEDPCLQCLEPGEDGGSCVEFSGIHITNAHVTGKTKLRHN